MDNPGKNDTIGQLMGDIIPSWPGGKDCQGVLIRIGAVEGNEEGKRIRKNLDFQ